MDYLYTHINPRKHRFDNVLARIFALEMWALAHDSHNHTLAKLYGKSIRLKSRTYHVQARLALAYHRVYVR
jgi:hypothetical protein